MKKCTVMFMAALMAVTMLAGCGSSSAKETTAASE